MINTTEPLTSNDRVQSTDQQALDIEPVLKQAGWTLSLGAIAAVIEALDTIYGPPTHETCDALTEAHCYEGEKDYQIDQLLDYLHYDPDTRSHPDWVSRAQAAEAELQKAKRCVGCGGTLVLPDRCDDCSSQKAKEQQS